MNERDEISKMGSSCSVCVRDRSGSPEANGAGAKFGEDYSEEPDLKER